MKRRIEILESKPLLVKLKTIDEWIIQNASFWHLFGEGMARQRFKWKGEFNFCGRPAVTKICE